MSAELMRPRSAIELIDAAFEICRGHFPVLFAVVLAVLSPVLLLSFAFPDAEPLIRLCTNLLFLVADGAVIGIVSEAYLGNPTEVMTGLRMVKGRFGRLLGASMYRSILVMLGLICFIVPGVIVLAWTFAMPMVIVLEGTDSAGEAFKRSRELARGYVGRILGTYAIAFVAFIVIGVGLSIAVGLLLGNVVSSRVLGVFETITMLVSYPFLAVTGTLLYYDLRIRKEGFDLEIMARELGGAEAREKMPLLETL